MIWLVAKVIALAQLAAEAPQEQPAASGIEVARVPAPTAAFSSPKRVAWPRGSFLGLRSAWAGDPGLGSQRGIPIAAAGYRLDAF